MSRRAPRSSIPNDVSPLKSASPRRAPRARTPIPRCFRLDFDADELAKRSCFFQAMERRRRERMKEYRERSRGGGPVVEEGVELLRRRDVEAQ